MLTPNGLTLMWNRFLSVRQAGFRCVRAPRTGGPRRASLGVGLTLLLGLVGLVSLGCGGGGGSGGGATSSAAATGSVAVVLTDAPTDEFIQAFVTVTRIDLLADRDDDDSDGEDGSGGRVTIFEGRETFDLLALENVSDPFVLAEDVPARRYEKLRLEVEDIELIRRGPDGDLESVFPRLQGPQPGGRIDLNPRGGFEVEPGSLLAVRLDIDARRSIQINETGKRDVLFRPQVFVEIMSVEEPGRLLLVEGVVEELDREADPVALRLCEVAIHLRTEREVSDRPCLTVFVDEGTSIFDRDARPTDLDAIFLGDRVAVFGRFAEAREDDEERLAIAAELIELGGSEAFGVFTGVVSGAFDEASGTVRVDLDPTPGFAEDSILEVELVDETRLSLEVGRGARARLAGRGCEGRDRRCPRVVERRTRSAQGGAALRGTAPLSRGRSRFPGSAGSRGSDAFDRREAPDAIKAGFAADDRRRA